MPETTMRAETGGPHLFGLAKVDDADTLGQIVGGWWPGMDDVQPQRSIAGVDAHGEPFVIVRHKEGEPGRWQLVGHLAEYLATLPFPVHIINAVRLPAGQVKPASEARPYRR